MNEIFTIDHTLDIPVYQQLTDRIAAAVKSGKLTDGEQLPTVQELADQLSLAKGTVKRAYDELERTGMIEKVRGRGTFVCYHPVNTGSRKEQAMHAIDKLLDRLEGMGFSATETEIFLTLKLRERFEDPAGLKVAVLECNPEVLQQMTEQLRSAGRIDLYSHLMEEVEKYPYRLDEEVDLVVTTTEHAAAVEAMLPNKAKLLRVALRPSTSCLSRIIRLRAGAKIGILSGSPRFAEIAQRTCLSFNHGVVLEAPGVLTRELDVTTYLRGKDAVLVPMNYERYADAAQCRVLQLFAETHELIPCAYRMDEGSMMYVEERIRREIEKK